MTINIAFCLDSKYAPGLGVVLTSMFINNPNKKFNIYILYNNIKSEDIDKINLTLDRYKASVNFIQIEESLFSTYEVSLWFSKTVYYRLLLPEILKDVSKVLYLDCDLLILGDIQELYNTDIDTYALAAVRDHDNAMHLKRLDMDANGDFVNTGVMLINLNYWREHNISDKCLSIVKEKDYKVYLMDQDLINVVTDKKKLILDRLWNRMPYKGEDTSLYQQMKTGILHFNCPTKLWDRKADPVLQNVFLKYADMSLWKNFLGNWEKNIDKTPKPSIRARVYTS